MKTMIAVPCMDQVPTPFCQSLALLKRVGDCTLAMKSGSLIYEARNSLAMQAIQMEADYVLWLDSDMVFQPDTLVRLMDFLENGHHVCDRSIFQESAAIYTGYF